ncbi:MAG TPA: ABC transporter permease [bacterium]|nr:ABC transporter permease [bacterium]HPR86703.1 ABC transporter permease [bacterium]
MSHLLETIKEILHYLRQYKGRTFMTLFGIIWGTVSIVVLLAFGVGVHTSMSKNMHGMGESIAILWPGRTALPYMGFGRDRYINFIEEDAELLRREIRDIRRISPEYSSWNAALRYGEKINKPNISGVIPEYAEMRNIQVQPGGRWLDEIDLRERKRVVFLGDELAKFLFGEGSNPVGKYLFVSDSPFLVIGVLAHKTQNSSYSSRDQDRAFIPASTFQSMFGYRHINNMVYQISGPLMSEQVQKRVYEVLGKKKGFDPKDKEALGIWDTTEMDKFTYYFSLGFNIFMGVIGVMTLTVGGIGLANIMYVVVQERTAEIGVRRSIGARRSHIMAQFLLESFIIVVSGALIGFLLAALIIKGIAAMPYEEYVGDPALNLRVALITMVILGLVGMVAGWFPARKASRLNVIDCLRH